MRLLLLGLGLILTASVYTGWVFYSRSRENHGREQIEKAKKAEDNRKFLQLYGSDAVKISNFYANPVQIRRGGASLLCYSVLNAEALHLDPPAEPVHPALSYCFNVAPTKTTTYTLTAEGKGGGKATQSITVIVK